jgi:hypothetical protein
MEEARRSSKELPSFTHLVETEASGENILCLTNELRALFQIVHHRDLSICVAAVHERKLDRRTRVTAVLQIEWISHAMLFLRQLSLP